MGSVTVSIRLGRLPKPGTDPRRWEWDDVLGRPPPGRRGKAGKAAYTVRHGFDEDEDPQVRVAFATVTRVAPDDDGTLDVAVEELISIEPRVLSGVLTAERAVTRRVAAGSSFGLRLVRTGGVAVAQRMGGRPGAALERGTGITVNALEWVGRTVRDTVHAVLEAPDRLYAGATMSGAHLARRRERRELLRGLLEPRALTREGKAAALFVAGALLVAVSLAVTLSLFLFKPSLLTEWRAVLLYFALGIGSTVLFPFFPEFRLASVAEEVGGPAAILSVALGMTAGAWLVLFLGDAIHGTLRAGIRPGSRLSRALDWAEAFAVRRGFWAAFLILSIPLGPDTPVFYLLATVRTPTRDYLMGTLLGTLVRFSLWYYVPIFYYEVLFPDSYVGAP